MLLFPPGFVCVFGNRILQSKLNMGLLCSTQHMAADVWNRGGGGGILHGVRAGEGRNEGEPQNGNKGKLWKKRGKWHKWYAGEDEFRQ